MILIVCQYFTPRFVIYRCEPRAICNLRCLFTIRSALIVLLYIYHLRSRALLCAITYILTISDHVAYTDRMPAGHNNRLVKANKRFNQQFMCAPFLDTSNKWMPCDILIVSLSSRSDSSLRYAIGLNPHNIERRVCQKRLNTNKTIN